MTDTAAAHEILRSAWSEVQRFDRYALGVLGVLITAPSPAPTRDSLAVAAGVPRAIVDHAIDQLTTHGYAERLRTAVPHLAGVLAGSPAHNAPPPSKSQIESQHQSAPEPPAAVKAPNPPVIPLAIRRAFSIATDTVLDALDDLENAPLALADGPSLAALEKAARDRLRARSKFTGDDLENLAVLVANHVWNYAEEEPSDRRQHVLETIPRVPVDPRQAIRSELSWLLHGRHTYKSVLTTCRSLCVEANNHAASLRLETAVASEPLTPEQTEAAAIKMAQWVWSQREKNPPKHPQGNRQKRQKPQR